ncbi:hypothetical protein [Quisquiliibacterium transsilvanicum]|uniref:Uncharacterized protein n=1 Tax=Quisquiliibacterium transsilvanicum TaxID=1549638 RepID=A0A7W8HIH0_9BURK|nr:hypothetical protein [Quisquiliibacterium transsilvanicum]MBB5272538.1 hypothetical protein [Quisquiliibacterium transsilvanicum]
MPTTNTAFPTLQQVRNDLVLHLYSFAYAQELVVRRDAPQRLLGVSDDGLPSWPRYEEFDLRPFVFAQDLERIYQYAFYGQLTGPIDDDAENGNLGRLGAFVDMTCAGDVQPLLEELQGIFDGDEPHEKALGLQEMVRRARARYALGAYSELDLEDLALLANVSLRTVRNAQHASGESRLATIQSRMAGKSVVVSAKEAARWLRGRQNFQPTVWVGSRESTPASLAPNELQPFIRANLAEEYPAVGRSEVLESLGIKQAPADRFGIQRDTASRYLDVPRERLDEILDGDVMSITDDECDKLSIGLAVDRKWLAAQIDRARAQSADHPAPLALPVSGLDLEALTLDVVLHEAGIRNGYLDIERRYADQFFPPDVYGARGEGEHGVPVELHHDQGGEPWRTDLRVKSKALVSPRRRFVGYFTSHKAKAGDVVRFKRIGERSYQLEFLSR